MHTSMSGFDHCTARWIVHEGARLYVEERGNPGGAPIVGDAGNGGDAATGIACPVLMVRGDGDPLAPLEHLLPLRARLKDVALANLPLAGHVAVDEQPALFVEVVQRFLARG
jgi:pimeloyl-ACP methyl ester carboxylesterase